MNCVSKEKNTPGGRSTRHQVGTQDNTDSGGPELTQQQKKSESSGINFPRHKQKKHTFFGTLNINTLIQPGKLHQLVTELDNQRITLLALQETRFTDEESMEYGNYRIFKGKTNRKVGRGTPLLGMAFAVHKSIIKTVKEVTPINNRLMTMRMKHKNRHYTIVNAHAPTNVDNKKDPEGVEKYWETLEKIISKINKDDTILLMGDFNAQLGREKEHRQTIGKFSAHRFTNKNGTRLVDTCRNNNLQVMSTALRQKGRKKKTWRSPISEIGEFQIDHVAISGKSKREIQNVQVRRGANIDSDHYLTRIKIKLTPKNKHKKRTPIQKYDLTKIQTTNIRERWENKQAKNWDEFKEKITEIAREVIPLEKKQKHPWWNQECNDAIQERKRAYEKYTANRTPENQKELDTNRKNTTRTLRRTRREYLKKQLDQVEEDFRNYNARDFYRTITNRIKGYTPQNLCFKDPQGKLALNNEENCELLANYFEQLLNCPEPKVRFPENKGETNKDSPAPTKEEIKGHIRKLKNGKTSGEDGIVAELLKNLGEKTLDELTQIITEIWETETIPKDWRCALIHPLHKKGDRTDVNNYRGISLLSVPYKILSACLLKRVQEQIEGKIGEYQAGFRPNRGCTEQIWNLKTILKHRATRHSKTICTFVDFKKAYDSIDRKGLINILTEYGLDNKTKALTQQTITNTTNKIKFMGEHSREFEVKTGVRQGDGLSPLLFNIALDKVINEWEKTNTPMKLGRNKVKISCLAFADDLAILAESEQQAIQQIESLKEMAEKIGLQISFEKTEFIGTQTELKTLDTRYGKIKRVEEFKYLGEIITPTGLEGKAQQNRLNKMKRMYGQTYNIYNKRNLGVLSKIRHYNTVVKPTALYAAETLTLNSKKHQEEIRKEERKIIRKILGPRKKDGEYRLRSNKEVESHSDIVKDIRKRRLKFYGHISRMDDTRLTKQIFTYMKKLKNNNWFSQTEQDLEKAKITQTDILDRTTFRTKINKWEIKPEEEVRKQRTGMTEERKQALSQRMKEIWEARRNSHRK